MTYLCVPDCFLAPFIGILLAHEFPTKVKALNCFPHPVFDGWGQSEVKVSLAPGF